MWRWIFFLFMLTHCAGGSMSRVSSSEAINEQEAVEYQKSLIRCHKTGGSRVVKIAGTIRCF
ncbi:MAG: hypothetical protein AB8C84_05170 [Oligoflexales bacterium]